jgi:hypothetical protein
VNDDDMDCVDDMPALNDTRRIVRLAMVMDEVRRIARAFRYGKLHEIRSGLSDREFFICGGAAVEGESYSFYRQLVLAKRDADAYSQRGIFPPALCIKQAYKLYEFYPSDEEDMAAIESARVSCKDHTRMKRVAFVLKRFRRAIRSHGDDLATLGARLSFAGVQLSKDEFTRCGGHRTVSAKNTYCFYRQLVLACRDMRVILMKGRHCKTDNKGKHWNDILSISSEDEEDVDRFDAQKTGQTRSLHDDGVIDDNEEDICDDRGTVASSSQGAAGENEEEIEDIFD